MEFSKQNPFNKDANFTSINFGVNKPLLEVELNEMQSILRGYSQEAFSNLYGDGVVGKGDYSYSDSTFSLKNEIVLLQGNLLKIDSITILASEGESIYLHAWEEEVTYQDEIHKHGNSQSEVIPNHLKDSRVIMETTRRTQLKYALAKETSPTKDWLLLGTITNGAFVMSCRILNTANSDLMQPVEGSTLKIDNVEEGYLASIEILGNTIQDAENPSDIKSMGDLRDDGNYNIPILVTNGLEDSNVDFLSQNINIISPVQLCKVKDVEDKITCKNGVWGVEKYLGTEKLTSDDIYYVDRLDTFENTICVVFTAKNDYKVNINIKDGQFINSLNLPYAYNRQDTPHVYKETAINLFMPKGDFANEQEVMDYFNDNPFEFITLLEEPQFIPLPNDQQVKLKTFKGTTHIDLLTEVKGTLKAEIPKSLGGVVRSQGIQLDLLNEEVEKIKTLESSKNLMEVSTQKPLTTIEDTHEGYLQDIKVEGDTLVNLSKTKAKTPVTHKYEDINGRSGEIVSDKEGYIDIDRIKGNTLVNVCNHNDSVPITKSYTVNGTNHVPLQGDYDGKARPNVHGNTLVNVSKQKEKTPITRNFDDIVGNGGKLKVGEVANKKGHVRVDKIVGNTLVNLQGKRVKYFPSGSGDNVILTINDNITCYEYEIEPNTTYTLEKFTESDRGNVACFESNIIGSKATQTKMSLISQTNTIATITTGANDKYLYTYVATTLLSEDVKLNVLKGDYTNKPIPNDFINGLQSSFESNLVTQDMVTQGLESAENLGKYKVPVKVIGKNLFDKNNLYSTGYSIDGFTVDRKGFDLNVQGKTHITITHKGSLHFGFFDVNDLELANDHMDSSDLEYRTISIPNNCKTIKFGVLAKGISTDSDLDTLQIEEGTVATDYEEYFERTKAVYLNSPLLKDDEIVMHNGKLCHYHNRNIDILDGINKNWKLVNYDDNYAIFIAPKPTDSMNQTSGLICDKFLGKSGIYNLSTQTEGIAFDGNGNIYMQISVSKLTSVSVEGFNTWLQQNNVTIVYKLVEPYYEVIDTEDLTLECTNDSTIYVDSLVPVENISFKAYEEELSYLYTSKAYKVKFTSDAVGTCDITLGGTQLLAQNIKVGINEFSITTPETLTDNKLVIEGDGLNIEKVSVVDTNLDFDYFEGIYSCFENQLVTDSLDPNYGKYKVEYKVIGKNKFDGEIENGGINWLGEDTPHNCTRTKNYILVEPNTTYMLVTPDYSDNIYVHEYDINKKGVGTEKVIISSRTFTTGANTRYVRFNSANGGEDSRPNLGTNIQLEEGKVATEFEEYKEYIKTFYLNSPLLKGDTIEEINGKLTHVHRYSSVVLDGSREWIDNNNNSTGCYTVKLEKYPSIDCKTDSTTIISDILRWRNGDTWTSLGDNEISVNSNNGMIYVFTKIINLEEFKLWLQENPIKVVYKLATPIYETISEDNRIIDSYVNGHLDLDSIVPVEKVEFLGATLELTYLYPSTKYTVQFESDNVGKCSLGIYASWIRDVNVYKGTNKVQLTTVSELLDTRLILDGIGFNASNISVVATDLEYSHFTGIQSSFEGNLVTEQMITDGLEDSKNLGKYKVPIKVVGKNLFNGKLKLGTLNSNNHSNTNRGMYGEQYIKVNPNTSYCINVIGVTIDESYKTTLLDENQNYLGVVWSTTFTVPSNCYYVRVGFMVRKDLTESEASNILLQLEEGTITTDYEDYFESTKAVYLNSPLLKGDELVWKGGELYHYHKGHKVTLNGSEGWAVGTTNGGWTEFDDTLIFFTTFGRDDAIKYEDDISLYSGFVCDKLPHIPSLVNINKIGVSNQAWGIKGHISIRLNKTDLASTDESGFTKWLQANPTTVVYELAEPYYEKVSDSTLLLNIPNTKLYIDVDSIIPPTSISFKSFVEELAYINPGTKYKISFQADSKGEVEIYLGGEVQNYSVNNGLNELLLNSPVSPTDKLFKIDGQAINISEVVVAEEGYNKYFEGLLSVGEDIEDINIATSVNKIPTLIQGGFTEEGIGIEVLNRLYDKTFYENQGSVKILINEDYQVEVVFYSKAKTKLSSQYWCNNLDTIQPPLGCAYYRFAIRHKDNINITPKVNTDFKFTTKYITKNVLYKDKDGVYRKPVLRGVSNTVRDYIEKHSDGKYYYHKVCEEVILDGSEQWIQEGTPLCFYIPKHDMLRVNNYLNSMICDKLPVDVARAIPFTGITGYANLSAYVGQNWIYIRDDRFTSVDSIKQWLQANPMTVIYQLATEEVYECINLDLNTYKGNTNLIIESGTVSPKITAKVSQNISNIVSTLKDKTEVLEEKMKEIVDGTTTEVTQEGSFITLTECNDGYVEDIKIEGNTLFNFGGSIKDSFKQYADLVLAPKELKPNTVYTFMVRNKAAHNVVMYANEFLFKGTKDKSVLANSSIIFKETTKDSTATSEQRALLKSRNVTGTIYNLDVLCIEGDYTNTPIPGYFEGIKSVGDTVEALEVTSSNKNLLDVDDFIGKFLEQSSDAKIENIDGERCLTFSSDSRGKFTYPLNLKPNTSYTFKSTGKALGSVEAVSMQLNFSDGTTDHVFRCWNYNGKFEDRLLTTPSNKTIVSLSATFWTGRNKGALIIDSLAIVENANTEVVPHKSSTKPLYYKDGDLWEKVVLRKVGDVADTIEKHSNGKYYYHKRCDEVVLNGGTNEDWDVNHIMTQCICFYIRINGVSNEEVPIMDKFKELASYEVDSEGTFKANNNALYITLLKSKVATENASGIKTWLQSNPVTAVYPLAYEEVYECTPLDVSTYEGYTNIAINSGAISPSKVTVKVIDNLKESVRVLKDKVSNLENQVTSIVTSKGSGWCKLPNGLILQWGKTQFKSNNIYDGRVQFPIAFPNEVFNVHTTITGTVLNHYLAAGFNVVASQTDLTGFLTYARKLGQENLTDLEVWITWFAIGR